ncbi:MAG: hypothetical protein WBB23_16295 [Desulforhopalus sp.]
METVKMTKQMIDFQKTVFDNTFNGVVFMQDYSQNMLDGFMRQFPWVTEQNQKPLKDTVELMKKARTDYKKAVDQGFHQLENMINTK